MSGRRECIITANANTGIYLALQVIRERLGIGEVILPTVTCISVAEIVVYAGFVPVFADVVSPDCTLDVTSVAAAFTERTRAIIVIHIFGNPAPIVQLTELTQARGVSIIENVAQATGGTIACDTLGGFGTFAVHSFGATKIAAAGGGGALVTDDPHVARERWRTCCPLGAATRTTNCAP